MEDLARYPPFWTICLFVTDVIAGICIDARSACLAGATVIGSFVQGKGAAGEVFQLDKGIVRQGFACIVFSTSAARFLDYRPRS